MPLVTVFSAGADAIYYTTDGSTPTRGSTLYTSSVPVTTSLTLKALAVKAGFTDSDIGTAVFIISGAMQVGVIVTPGAGTYMGAQTITLSSAGADNIYYTTDGTTATSASTLYTAPIVISVTTTLNSIAITGGYSPSFDTSDFFIIDPLQTTPTFSPVGNAYTTAQEVTITSVGADDIFYTTDGSTPTSDSTVYSGPVFIGVDTVLQAFAIAENLTDSDVGSAQYFISNQQFTPSFTPPANVYGPPQLVTITSGGADAIYYSLDGSPPSILYTNPILISSTQFLQALAVKSGFIPSSIGSALYTIVGTNPTITSITQSDGTGAWNQGPTTGGNPTTITGTFFAANATVTFDGIPVAVTFIDTTQLGVVPPPHIAGAVTVTVTNP